MRISLHSVVFMCAFAVPAASTVAQITITEDDLREKLAVGKSLVTMEDTLTSSVSIGSRGSTSWDFSGLLNHTATTLVSVAPSSTPYISQFPDATFAYKTDVTVSGISLTAYVYLVLATNLLNPGSMGGTPTFLGDLVVKRVNTPSDLVYVLPSTFGTTWTSTYTEKEDITLGGNPLSSTTRDHNFSYIVDGYGPMMMPGGQVHEALRIRRQDSTSSARYVNYIFLAKNGASVQVTATDPVPPDSGTIQVSEVTWNGPVPTDVRIPTTTPTEFRLFQNYPNPFNPTTTIAFAVPHRVHVTLKVFSLLGEEMATLVDETMESGTRDIQFNAAGLASGVYIYRLQAGEFVQSRRLTLLR